MAFYKEVSFGNAVRDRKSGFNGAVNDAVESRLAEDSAGEYRPRLDVVLLKKERELYPRERGVLSYGEGEIHPLRLYAAILNGQDKKLLVSFEERAEMREIIFPNFPEMLQLVHLHVAEGRAHFDGKKVVPHFVEYEFCVVRQAAQSASEALGDVFRFAEKSGTSAPATQHFGPVSPLRFLHHQHPAVPAGGYDMRAEKARR